jgi:hypothetical protein
MGTFSSFCVFQIKEDVSPQQLKLLRRIVEAWNNG